MPEPEPQRARASDGRGLARRLDDLVLRLFAPLARRDRVVSYLLLALVVHYVATPGIFEGKASGDGMFGFYYLPSLTFHHTFDLNPAGRAYALPRLGMEPTGHIANPCPIGTLPFWLPTYLLGVAGERLVGLFVKLPAAAAAGASAFDFWMAGLGSLACGLVGIALLFRLVERKLGRAAARFGTLAAVAATPLVWYLTTQPLYQHAVTFMVVTWFVERWDAWRRDLTIRRFAFLGALGGLAALTRLQEATFLILPGLDAAWGVIASPKIRGRARFLVGGVVLAAVAFAVYLPQLLVWKFDFGRIHPPQATGHMRWLDPALVAMLFSTRGGLIAWSPLVWLVVPGLVLARRKMDGLAWRMGLLLAMGWWVNASCWDHWASWTFGARRFTDDTVAFAFGFAGIYSVVGSARAKKALAVLLGVAIAWNALLVELVRERRMKSSGAAAAPVSTWVRWARGPSWLGKVSDKIGLPWIQPVGWIYAWIYDAPVTAFEGVVGNYLHERDCRIHEVVLVSGFAFADALSYVVEGEAPPPAQGWPRDAAVPATGARLRILVPLYAKEPLVVKLTGDFVGQDAKLTATWNGTPLKVVSARGGVVKLAIPAELVHTRARTNVLVLDGVPQGAKYKRLDFEGNARWWE